MQTTKLKRRAFFFIADIVLIALSMYLAFWLRFDGYLPPEYTKNIWYFIGLSEIILLAMLILHGCYNITWRFFSVREGLMLLTAMTGGNLILGFIIFFIRPGAQYRQFPRSVYMVNFVLTIVLIGSLRVSKRAVREFKNWRDVRRKGKQRVLIIGAGAAGEQIAREMINNPRSRYWPIGFIDDDASKSGTSIHGIKVLGKREELRTLLASHPVDEFLIAMPSAHSGEIREVFHALRECDGNKKIKILPGIINLMNGNVALKDVHEINVEDLLGRQPVSVDHETIRKFLTGKRVLVTGAGGSIGSELSKLVLQFAPARLGLLDSDETELFYLVNKIKGGQEGIVFPIVGDIRDVPKMEALFSKFKPQIVIHSAAYKHVPILEHYPEEAVKTNILGTRNLSEAALKHGVERFVNISTDKAINPTSVMGATKRIGEELLKVQNERNGTRFISVRFGNVLGSRGSVIPLFREQIKKGGPVRVTHPDMKRYFMATSEAVLLVLQAAAAGQGGEVYVLDMGTPVNISDMAKEMIRLSGFEPDVEIEIAYCGLRAGEKLFEELLGAEEGSERTSHNEKIFRVLASQKKSWEEVWGKADKLIHMCSNGCQREEIRAAIKDLVPTYRPDEVGAEINHW